MTEVVVTSVLSQGRGGVIFSGLKTCGAQVRVVVSGEPVFPVPGEVYEVDENGQTLYRDGWGRWHPQLEVDRIDRVRTSGALLRPWLERQPNVGPTRAGRLMARYPGEALLEALQGGASLDELSSVIEPGKPAMGDLLAAQLIAAFAAQSARDSAAVEAGRFLQRLESYGVENRRDARLLWRLLAGVDDLRERLLRYPYLAASILPWSSADRLGLRLLAQCDGVDDPLRHPERLLGAVESAWINLQSEGDTAATPQRLREVLVRKQVEVGRAIDAAIKAGVIIVDGTLYRAPGAVYLENRVAQRLRALLGQPVKAWTSWSPEELVCRAAERSATSLYDEQADAVAKLLRMPLGVLQGPAGSGKTRIAKVLCEAWEETGGNVVLCALAGKAALELSRGASSPGTARTAFTIARLLATMRGNIARVEAGESPLPNLPRLDARTLVIIDEASMVDTPGFGDVLDLLPAGGHLLAMGDPGQLPPVGIGRVFHDLVEDGRCVVSLRQVRRQGPDSPIALAAAAIRNGEVPALPAYQGPLPGIFLCETASGDEVETANEVYRELRFRPGVDVRDVMFVAALKKTVNAQNARCVSARSGTTGEVRLSRLTTVAVGDPVACTRNRYADGLFNGTLGVVTSMANGRVHVWWDGEEGPREVSPMAAGDVELAYAMTCHRAQGSAAPIVVVPLEDSRLMTREWLYTAVSRARVSVVLVGTREAMRSAIGRRTQRVTGFRL